MKKLLFLLIALLLITPVLASAATVTLTPASPTDGDQLTCDVAASTAKFIYKWYRNGVYQSTSPELASSIMSAAYTSPGDTWNCKAYTPGSLLFPSTYVGEATVTIAGTSTTIPPSNHAPVLQTIGSREICAGQATTIPLQGTDSDNDILTYSVSPMPSGSTICDWNGIFQWTPTCAQLGVYQDTFKVTDEHGAYDSETVMLTVKDCGGCGFKPKLDPIPDKTVCAGDLVTITSHATYLGGDTLRYSVSRLPPGGVWNAATHTLTWQTTRDDINKPEQMTFIVEDDHCNRDYAPTTIYIKDCSPPENKCPVFYAIGDRNICEGAVLSFSVAAYDPDSDPVTITATGLPSGASFSSGNFYWKPNDGQNGDYYVTFKATDGKCANPPTSQIKIHVDDCIKPNICPSLTSIGPKTVCEGAQLYFQVSASDPDAGDVLTYSASGLPSGANFNSGTRAFSWTPVDGQNGNYFVTFSVSDSHQCQKSELVQIHVDDCIQNHPPVLTEIGAKTICEGAQLQFCISASDQDGNALTYSAVGLPSGAVFNSNTKCFSWTPVDGQNGNYQVTFSVSDGQYSDSETVPITVSDCICNHAPVLDPIGDKTICIGSTLTFPIHGTDPDGDALTYSASNLPSGAVFNPSTRYFTWTPQSCQGGTCHPTFCVSDGRLSDCETISITVNNCNLPPVLTEIGSKTVCEGQQLPFCITATDPNGDVLTYSVSNLPSGAVFNSNTKCFSWTPVDGQNGNYAPTFTVSDGQYTDSETVSITVNDCICNHPPVLDPIGDRTVCIGSTLTFTTHGTDPDGDALIYSASNIPSGSVFNPGTQVFTWTPQSCQGGTCHPTFCVSDGRLSDCETITITVNNCNLPPVLTEIGSKTVCEGQQLPFCITATDPNGDALTYSASGLPSGAVFNSNTKCFSWTPVDGQNGNYQVTFTVSDGQYTDSETVPITVTDCICNHAPVLDPIGDKTICMGSTLTFPIHGTDVDGDALTYSASNIPSGSVFNPGTQVFTWTPQACQGGTCHPTFCVSDGKLSDCETITITVNNCNQPPVLTEIGSKTVCEGVTLPFCITATDPNGDALTFSASGLPSGAVFNSNTKCFSWTPVDGQNGNYQVTFSVSDGQSSDSETVPITVNDCIYNHPPVLTEIGAKTICEGAPLQFCISATDPDGNALTYSASGLPSGAVFNSNSKCFSWTPVDGQNGNYQVTFSVSDGQYSDSETVPITVTDCICNHAPVLDPIGDKTICMGSTLTFPIHGTDVDGDALTYSASNIPSGSVFNPGTQVFTWTPQSCQGGTCHPTFCVSDGRLSDCETIAITVNNCNLPPVLTEIGSKTVCEGATLPFCITATDPNGDALTFSASGLPSGAVFNSNTKCFSWTPVDGQNGNYQVTFTVSDGQYSDSEIVPITVNDCICNHPPVLDPIGDKSICIGSTLTFTIHGTDPDGDALTYSASNIPSGSVFNPNTQVFTWTPQACQGSTCHPTFCVSDGRLSDCETIAITVNNCNQPPVLEHIGDKTVCEGSQLQFCVHATDPNDADMLMYSVVGLPSGAVFNSNTKCFSWTPIDGQNGVYHVTFSVTDDMYTVSEGIAITVNDCLCNHAPVLDPIGDKSICIGSTLTFTIHGTDPDGDALTYSASGIPSGSVFNPGTQVFTWTPQACQGATCRPTFCVSDGRLSDCETITIVVSNCNQGPTFAIPDQYMDEGQTLNLNLNSFASDPNGDALSFARVSGVGSVTGATYTYYADYSSAGNHQVSLIADDGKGGQATATFTIHVTEQLEIETIQCFPVVIKGSQQSCTVTLTEKIGGVSITLKDFTTGAIQGTCTTDALTGACTDNFPVNELGIFTVYATAVKQGYLSDTDKVPSFEYRVIAKRYNIEELKVYNDPAYTQEDYDFFRGEDMYVKFLVRDMTSGGCTTGTVTAATLVSPPGGRADLNEFKPAVGCYYYFHLRIPPTHGFLGSSQVFTFAFNFTDNTGGEAVVDLTIRNNPPYIQPVVPNQNVVAGSTITFNLAAYKHDLEDSGADLRWQVSGFDPTMATVSVNGDVLTITGVRAGQTGFVLKLFDLDNDFATQAVWINLGCQRLPPIANPNGPYTGTVGTMIQFSSLGSNDPDGGSIASYLWNFGDGTTSNEAHPVHTYTTNGTFTVTLTVTDSDDGLSATGTTQAIIGAIKEPEKRLYNDDLLVKHLSVGDNNLVSVADRSIPIRLSIENLGVLDIHRLKLTLMVRELGLMLSDKNIELQRDDVFSKTYMFENPGIAGKFTLMLHIITEDGIERTKFVEFEVINGAFAPCSKCTSQ